MIIQHSLIPTGLDFSDCVARHSGDLTVSYRTVAGEPIYMSFYYPADTARQKFPAIVLVHGGCWRSHKIFPDQDGHWQGDHLGYLARYYADRGFVCVSIDYRLSAEDFQREHYQLIDCYDDCVYAMDYILENAASHHMDTDSIYILGESAGGHLAGMLATAYTHEKFRFRQAFLVNPILDFEHCDKFIRMIPRQTQHSDLAQLSFIERARYLSPICQIREDICPVVLMHGAQDTTVDILHSTNFHKAMERKGHICDFHIIENTNHAFLLAEYTDNPTAAQTGVEILNTYLL